MKRKFRQGVMLMMSVLLVLSCATGAFAAEAKSSGYKDLSSNHWALKAIERWNGVGIINGYEDNTMRPDQKITRAEFAKLINMVFGFKDGYSGVIQDNTAATWFKGDISKAVEAGYLTLDGSKKASPKKELSRAEAAVAFDYLFGFSKASEANASSFKDVAGLDAASVKAINALSASGYLKGYGDGTFKPSKTLSRAELVSLLDRLVSTLVKDAGELTAGTVKGNLVINRADVTLKDTVVEGNLYLTAGIGDGDVTLNKVTVKGKTVIEGGGVNSIGVIDSALSEVEVNKKGDQVRVYVSGSTTVDTVRMVSGAKLEESNVTSGGFKEVYVPEGDRSVELVGNFDKVATKSGNAPAATTIVIKGNVEELTLSSNVKVVLEEGAVVKKLIATEGAGKATVEGKGKIESVDNKADGLKVNGKPVDKGNNVKPDGSTGSPTPAPSTSTPMWTMVWNDEFDDGTIDPTKWAYDIGRGPNNDGWGNSEKEYYTSRPENVKEENGNLVITARKENYEGAEYTSTRIVTRGKYAQKFGKIEVKAKAPAGKGFWPAIWMLPENYEYGTWAASGEIDIMEGWGSMPGKVAGTLHYGSQWPGNTYTGKEYQFPNGSTIEDFHTYTLEWEPGEMRWYVDGVLYQTQNDWYSESAGQPADNAYPAPFDKEFHLLMNLAVGGHFDGDPTSETVFPKSMEIDYVRMYELTGRPYRQPTPVVLAKEATPSGARAPLGDGNLVYNSNFDQDLPDVSGIEGTANTDYWRLFQGDGGAGNVAIENIGGKNFAKINITSAGWAQHSVQLLNDITAVKGHYYKLSFDAKSNAERPLTVKVTGGPSRGYAAYSRAKTYQLTSDVQHFEMQFQMKQESDILARTEFNAGTNASPVWIGNVRVEEIDGITFNHDAIKKPLALDGNHVYNGSFDLGDVDRMAFWHFDTANGASATANVNWEARKLNVNISNAGDNAKGSVKLSQKGVELLQDQTYQFSIDASANANREIEVALLSKDGNTTYASQTLALTTTSSNKTFAFEMNQVTDHEAQLVIRVGGSAGTLTLDNIKLIRTSVYFEPDTIFYPLTNGNFATNNSGWTTGAEGGGALTAVNESGEAHINVTNQGANPWSSMFIWEDLKAWSGLTYKFSFDARASVARKMQVIFENSGYKRYFDKTVDLTTDMKTYSFEFTMTAKDTVDLKFLLGLISGTTAVGSAHDVFIDNVVFEVKGAPVPSPTLTVDSTNNAVGQFMELTFADDTTWRAAVTKVKVNNVNIPADKYTLEAGKLTLAASNFADDGNYLISILSNGYAPAVATQKVFTASGNLVLNGDFTWDGNSWGSWNGENSAATVTLGNNKAAVDISNVGDQGWAIQLFQDSVPVVSGKKYQLSFKGSSTADRPMTIEFGIYTNSTVKNLTAETQTFTQEFTATAAPMKLNFLLGKTASALGAHTVTISDVVVTELPETPVLIPQSHGENLIVNGSFDTTIADWDVWSDAIAAPTYTVEDGKLYLNLSQVGGQSHNPQLFQDGLKFYTGETYTVTFNVYGSAPKKMNVNVGLGLDSDPWFVKYVPTQLIQIGTSDTQHSFSFVMTQPTSENGKIVFELGQIDSETVTGAVYLDNISIKRDVIKNGHFTTDKTGWSDWWGDEWSGVATGTTSIEGGALKVEITQTGGASYSPQVFQEGLYLENGKTYTVKFKAKADQAKSINVNIGKALTADPWFTAYAATQKFVLGTDYAEYTYTFTVTEATEANAKMVFELGNIDGAVATDVYIDDVSITMN